MRDRRDIRARHAAGGTIRGIARDIGADRNSVRRALHPDANLDYERPTLADRYEPAVHDALADFPRMTVAQVAELIEWPGSRRALSDLVAKVRPTVLEREREDLNRPAVGTVTSGRMHVGRLTLGRMTVGSVTHGTAQTTDDPRRTAGTSER